MRRTLAKIISSVVLFSFTISSTLSAASVYSKRTLLGHHLRAQSSLISTVDADILDRLKTSSSGNIVLDDDVSRFNDVLLRVSKSLDDIRAHGGFIFDIDDTLLITVDGMPETLYDYPSALSALCDLIMAGYKIHIITQGSYYEQAPRIVKPIAYILSKKGRLEAIKNLSMYTASGSGKRVFSVNRGKLKMRLRRDYTDRNIISKDSIADIKYVVQRTLSNWEDNLVRPTAEKLAKLSKSKQARIKKQFGIDDLEYNTLRKLYLKLQREGIKKKFKNAKQPHLEGEKPPVSVYTTTFPLYDTDTAVPWIECRDNVMIAVRAVIFDDKDYTIFRDTMIEIISKALGAQNESYDIRSGGVSTIDISRRGANKAKAVGDIIRLKRNKKELLFFVGDKFKDRNSSDGVVLNVLPAENCLAVAAENAEVKEALRIGKDHLAAHKFIISVRNLLYTDSHNFVEGITGAEKEVVLGAGIKGIDEIFTEAEEQLSKAALHFMNNPEDEGVILENTIAWSRYLSTEEANEYPGKIGRSPNVHKLAPEFNEHSNDAKDAAMFALEGNIINQCIYAGSATRAAKLLGGSSKFMFDPSAVEGMNPEEFDPEIAEIVREAKKLDYIESLKALSLGARMFIQYRATLEKLAKKHDYDPAKAVENAKFIVHINDQSTETILGEFERYHFFGFNPENIVFVIQPTFEGYILDEAGNLTKYSKDARPNHTSWKRPFGHGYTLMQIVMPNQGFIVKEGVPIDIALSPLQYFRGRSPDVSLVANRPIEDLTKLTDDTINLQKLSTILKLRSEGHLVVAELVDNATGQKGASWNNSPDNPDISFLVETLQIKNKLLVREIATGEYFYISKDMLDQNIYEQITDEAEQKRIFKEYFPMNKNANAYDIDGLIEHLTKQPLRNYLDIREDEDTDGRPVLFMESITGDVTQIAELDPAAINNPGEAITAFKKPEDLEKTLRYMHEQDQDRDFVRVADQIIVKSSSSGNRDVLLEAITIYKGRDIYKPGVTPFGTTHIYHHAKPLYLEDIDKDTFAIIERSEDSPDDDDFLGGTKVVYKKIICRKSELQFPILHTHPANRVKLKTYKSQVIDENNILPFMEWKKHSQIVLGSCIIKIQDTSVVALPFVEIDRIPRLKAVKNFVQQHPGMRKRVKKYNKYQPENGYSEYKAEDLLLPGKLYYAGTERAIKAEKSVAIIGTTSPSSSGSRAAEMLAQVAAKKGWVVISGFVYGIDRDAHLGSLDENGVTIGVISNAVQDSDPYFFTPRMKFLEKGLLKNKGAIVSEYENGNDGLLEKEGRIMARNRLTSALSDIVVVIESRKDSGTIDCAKRAYLQGKKVYVVNWDLVDPSYAAAIETTGNEQLIEEGIAVGIPLDKSDISERLSFADMENSFDELLQTVFDSTITPKTSSSGINLKDLSAYDAEHYLATTLLNYSPTGIIEVNKDTQAIIVYSDSLRESPALQDIIRQSKGDSRKFFLVNKEEGISADQFLAELDIDRDIFENYVFQQSSLTADQLALKVAGMLSSNGIKQGRVFASTEEDLAAWSRQGIIEALVMLLKGKRFEIISDYSQQHIEYIKTHAQALIAA